MVFGLNSMPTSFPQIWKYRVQFFPQFPSRRIALFAILHEKPAGEFTPILIGQARRIMLRFSVITQALFALRRKFEFGVCKKSENFVITNFLFSQPCSHMKIRNFFSDKQLDQLTSRCREMCVGVSFARSFRSNL